MSAELATAHAAQNGLQGEPNSADKNVEMWKIKKLIKSLEAARGWVAYTDTLLHFSCSHLCTLHRLRNSLEFASFLEWFRDHKINLSILLIGLFLICAYVLVCIIDDHFSF